MINVDVNTLLPQKQPFVMVDSLLSYSEAEIKAGLTITKGNLFTSECSFLEAGLIEHMAQVVALHTGYGYYLRNEEAPIGYIGSINEVQILRLPKLGEVVESEVKILQEFMGITLVSVNSFINGEMVASGKMKTVLAS